MSILRIPRPVDGKILHWLAEEERDQSFGIINLVGPKGSGKRMLVDWLSDTAAGRNQRVERLRLAPADPFAQLRSFAARQAPSSAALIWILEDYSAIEDVLIHPGAGRFQEFWEALQNAQAQHRAQLIIVGTFAIGHRARYTNASCALRRIPRMARLPPFDTAEVQTLARLIQPAHANRSRVEALLQVTGGHPDWCARLLQAPQRRWIGVLEACLREDLAGCPAFAGRDAQSVLETLSVFEGLNASVLRAVLETQIKRVGEGENELLNWLLRTDLAAYDAERGAYQIPDDLRLAVYAVGCARRPAVMANAHQLAAEGYQRQLADAVGWDARSQERLRQLQQSHAERAQTLRAQA